MSLSRRGNSKMSQLVMWRRARRPRNARSARRTAILGAAWVLAAAMVALGALRLTGATTHTWQIRLLSVSPILFLPAWPLAGIAAVRRHWALMAVAIAVAGAELSWVGPQVRPWASAPAATSPARLRIFDANVSQSNRDLTGLAGEIRAARPQVVTLEELTPQAAASLEGTGVMDRFGYRLVRIAFGAGGMGLWSSLPLAAASSWEDGGGQSELQASVRLGGKSIEINAVHVFAPLGSGQPRRWRQQLAALGVHLRAERGLVVVAGDFNASADLPQFRSILHDGLSDGAVLAGDGWQMTLPRNQSWVIPYLRLDHVLVSSGLTVTRFRTGNDRGSDHRVLVTDIAPD